MSYTTVDNVAAMFPLFVRGGTSQKPADALIKQFIDDNAGELDAVLQRRFNEIILQSASFSAWVAGLTQDSMNVLEKINRYGAAAQLGETLASLGIAGARDLAKTYSDEYERMKDDLDARDSKGAPLASGPYDHLFDSLARTETPRPLMQGIAGGEKSADLSVDDQGLSNAFGKFDKRGT